MPFKKLPRSFYLRPTLTVAQELLGKHFVRKYHNATLIGRIVEAEAYCAGDPASHSFRGMTVRNEVMFWKGGHLYVYFTYGMHFCANVVTGRRGVGEAVLIRAVEPLVGIDTMHKNRGMPQLRQKLNDLTNGPAKFCQAFSIGRAQNGSDLLGDTIYLTEGEEIARSRILSSSRIGIRSGRDRQWRFLLENNPYVSRGKIPGR